MSQSGTILKDALTQTPKFSIQPQSFLYDNPKSNQNPQMPPPITQQNSENSVFVTDFYRKTKLFSSISLKKANRKKTMPQIKSWQDLQIAKRIYKCQILNRKSKQQLHSQNKQLIKKIHQSSSRIDTWNYYQTSKSQNQFIPVLLFQLPKKNKQLFKRIRQTSPRVSPWNFYQKKQTQRTLQMITQKNKIKKKYKQLMNKIQQLNPKIKCWGYKPNLNQNHSHQMRQKIKSQSKLKVKIQNIKLVQKINKAPMKVQSWVNITNLKNIVQKQKIIARNKQFQQIKSYIQTSELKLKKNEEALKYKKLAKYQSLPSKITQKLQKYKQDYQKSIKLIKTKIQHTKSQIDSWSSAKPIAKFPQKNSIRVNKTDDSNRVQALAKKVKQLNYLIKSKQIKSKILHNLNELKTKTAIEQNFTS